MNTVEKQPDLSVSKDGTLFVKPSDIEEFKKNLEESVNKKINELETRISQLLEQTPVATIGNNYTDISNEIIKHCDNTPSHDPSGKGYYEIERDGWLRIFWETWWGGSGYSYICLNPSFFDKSLTRDQLLDKWKTAGEALQRKYAIAVNYYSSGDNAALHGVSLIPVKKGDILMHFMTNVSGHKGWPGGNTDDIHGVKAWLIY